MCVPWRTIEETHDRGEDAQALVCGVMGLEKAPESGVFVLCRRGVLSARATRLLSSLGGPVRFVNVEGGLLALNAVDCSIPAY